MSQPSKPSQAHDVGVLLMRLFNEVWSKEHFDVGSVASMSEVDLAYASDHFSGEFGPMDIHENRWLLLKELQRLLPSTSKLSYEELEWAARELAEPRT